MANIKNIEMAAALSQNPHIQIRKSLFGLSVKAIYIPTGSPLTTKVLEFAAAEGERLAQLLEGPLPALVEEVKAGKVKPAAIGHMRLELVTARDGSFAATQLFRFVDFGYKAVSPIKYYEGEQAAQMADLF